MDIIKQLEWRYATKKFDKKKKLSKKKVDTLVNAFNLTATSFGLQTIKLVVVSGKKIRKQLVECSFGQEQVLNASHLLIICIQEKITSKDIDKLFDNTSKVRSTPETILAPYRLDLKNSMKSKSIEEQQQWSTNQAYIALGNLMTVCAIEEVDACPMEGFNPDEYDEIFKFKEQGLKSVLIMPVGYRDKDDFFTTLEKVRKNIKDVVIKI